MWLIAEMLISLLSIQNSRKARQTCCGSGLIFINYIEEVMIVSDCSTREQAKFFTFFEAHFARIMAFDDLILEQVGM